LISSDEHEARRQDAAARGALLRGDRRQLRGARLRGDCNSDGSTKEVPSRWWDGDWCWHAAHQLWGAISLRRPGGGHEIGRQRANGGGDLGIRTSRIADDDDSSGTSGIRVFSGADRIGFYKN